MSEAEEISNKIKDLGDVVASAKADKKPIEEWKSFLDEMLSLKVRRTTTKTTSRRRSLLTRSFLASY